MKSLLLIPLAFLFGPVGNTAVKNEGYLIKTTLVYRDAQKKDLSISRDFVLSSENKGWVTLTEFKDNVVLLGRAIKADQDSIQMEYLLVDGNQKPNVVVSSPSIVTRFNEPAEISIKHPGKTSSVSIALVAKRTAVKLHVEKKAMAKPSRPAPRSSDTF